MCIVPTPCRQENWQDAETYLLLILAILYIYHFIMLFFGTAHCLGLVVGELS